MIKHAHKYKKQHANGILEIFRKTTLPVSGLPAWQPVHKLASRFGKHTEDLDSILQPLLDKLCSNLLKEKNPDVGSAVSDFYWRVTLAIALGDDVEVGLPEIF